MFALALAGQYLRGFVVSARDSVLRIRLDNGVNVDHDYKSNPKAVIRDELPSTSELANGTSVIAASTPDSADRYYSGVIIANATRRKPKYKVRFDGNRGAFKRFPYFIRIVHDQ